MRHVADRNGFRAEDGGRQNRQRSVLGAGNLDLALKGQAAVDVQPVAGDLDADQPRALHHQHMLLFQQLENELLIVGDGIHPPIKLGEKIKRRLRLDAADPRDLSKQAPGELSLTIEPPAGVNQVVDALPTA